MCPMHISYVLELAMSVLAHLFFSTASHSYALCDTYNAMCIQQNLDFTILPVRLDMRSTKSRFYCANMNEH